MNLPILFLMGREGGKERKSKREREREGRARERQREREREGGRDLAVRETEGSHVQEVGKIDVATVLPQPTAVLEKPLEVQCQYWRQALNQQLLLGISEDQILFTGGIWRFSLFFLQSHFSGSIQ